MKIGFKLLIHPLYIIIFVIAVTILTTLIIVMKSGKKKKEQRRLAMEKLREEALDRALENPFKGNEGRDGKGLQRPVAVNYGQDEKTLKRELPAHGRCMLELTEINELSTRKYLLNPSEVIRIGRQFDVNTIVINNRSLSERQCEIFQHGQDLYIRNCSMPVPVRLLRKSDSVIVDERGIKIQSGDCINIGTVRLEVSIIRN